MCEIWLLGFYSVYLILDDKMCEFVNEWVDEFGVGKCDFVLDLLRWLDLRVSKGYL